MFISGSLMPAEACTVNQFDNKIYHDLQSSGSLASVTAHCMLLLYEGPMLSGCSTLKACVSILKV